MRRVIIGAGAALALVLAGAAPALANGGIALDTEITNSRISMTAENGQSCTWSVVSDVHAVNITGQSLTIQTVGAVVSYTGPNGLSGVDTDVSITDPGTPALESGATIPAGGQQTYAGFTTVFTIPCAATFGDLAVRISTPLGTGSGDAPFLESGAPLPVAAVGGVTLAGFLGILLVIRQRRRTVQSTTPKLTERQPA